jgi:hypothetical protein
VPRLVMKNLVTDFAPPIANESGASVDAAAGALAPSSVGVLSSVRPQPAVTVSAAIVMIASAAVRRVMGGDDTTVG